MQDEGFHFINETYIVNNIIRKQINDLKLFGNVLKKIIFNL